MLKGVMKLPLAAAALSALFLTGCMKYTLTPDRPASLPRHEAAPLPLKVGVIIEGPPPGTAAWKAREDEPLGPRFAEALRESRLFPDVFYPLPPNAAAAAGVDLIINGRFSSRYDADPLQGPKIFFVCFTGFFTGALMSETSHHLAEGALTVAYPDGRLVKTYNEKVDVVAVSMVSAFAEQKTMKFGPPSARENLAAKLVQALIADRDSFVRREAPAPAPATEPAPPVAAAEPAPPVKIAAEPVRPKRGPLTPAEESEIDEQLMP